jgi:hypothetical protein
MHRNTFRHRLRVAIEILGHDLENPDVRLATHVALKLPKVSTAPGTGRQQVRLERVRHPRPERVEAVGLGSGVRRGADQHRRRWLGPAKSTSGFAWDDEDRHG